MFKVLLSICFMIILTSCSVATQRSLQASIYADKSYECSGGNMVFKLEGASSFQKGYMRVNGSERVPTYYQDSGVESRWYWGAYSSKDSTVFDNTKHRYKLIVEASGSGVYYNLERNKVISLSCGELAE